MSVLAISCHTDDIELAAGGLISSLNDVYGYCPTYNHDYGHGFDTRSECNQAWGLLGIKRVDGVNVNHHAREIARQVLLDDLIKLRNEIQPELVITHGSFDTHQSHRVVYQESLRAFNCSILGYNHPWNCREGIDERFYCRLSGHQVDKKLSALQCYESQKPKWYFDLNWQQHRLQGNGYLCGAKFAEKFEIIRWIN